MIDDLKFSLRLPEQLLLELDREAKARSVTKGLIVRESLEEALLKRSPLGAASCYDLARDLAGSVKALPRDLADHPKYKDDFGE